MLWPIRILLWPLMLSLSLVLAIIGLPIVAYLAATKDWVMGASIVGKPIWVWKSEWAWLWSDSDQGIVGSGTPTPLAAFKWCALRNKVGNLRLLTGFKIDPKQVRGWGNPNLYYPLKAGDKTWSVAYQGLRAGLWWVTGMRQVRVGWAVIPGDADAATFSMMDARQMCCPFTVQINRR
jgi:hypothetical protein